MTLSYLVWGAWFALFAVLELTAAIWKSCPWRTLSSTAWSLEGLASWVPIIFLAGLVVLTVHIVFRWPK